MIQILIVIIIVCNIVKANDNEGNKFIDSLPANEKKAFLDRIARRILEKVKSKDVPNGSHADISDEQLDAQAAFVQDILREESENLKKKRRDNKYRKNNEELKPVTEITDDVISQERHIDLTLRTRNERISKHDELETLEQVDSTNQISYQTVPVKTYHDLNFNDTKNLESTQIMSELKANNDNSTTVSPDIDISRNVKNIGQLESKEKINFKRDLRIGTTVLIDSDSKSVESEPNNSAHYTSLSTLSEIGEDKTVTEVNETTKKPTIWDSTHNIYATQGYYSDEKSGEKNDLISNAETFTKSTTFLTQKVTDLDKTTQHLTTTNVFEEDTISVKLGKSEEVINNIETTTINLNHILRNNTNRDENDNLEFYTQKDNLIINSKEKDDLSTDSSAKLTNKYNITTEIIDDSANLRLQEQKNRSAEEKRKLTENNVEINERFKTGQNAIVNDQLLKNTDKKENLHAKSEIKTVVELQDQKMKTKEVHEVYEIEPQKSPFVNNKVENNKIDNRKKGENLDHSYYVPTYNYDPSNAYYNPYTRFVPLGDNRNQMKPNKSSKDKELSISNDNFLNKRVLRSWFGENSREKFIIKHPRPKASDTANILFNLLNIPKVRHRPPLYINTDDYVDYYLGRSLTRGRNKKVDFLLPNSNEKDHPYNSLNKNNIKNNLRDTRYLLNLNQSFGYEPISETKSKQMQKQSFEKYHSEKASLEMKTRNEHKLKKKKRSNQHNDKAIALDYYFGRQRSEEINDDITVLNNLLTKLPKYKRNTKSLTIKSLVTVLRDLVKMEDESLQTYPWLKSTVDIRAGIYKILDLIDEFHYEPYIHPKDVELLKYVFYLYKYSDLMIINEEKLQVIRELRKKSWLPTNKKKKIKEPLKMIRDVYSFLRDSFEDQTFLILHELEDFLNKVLFQLDLFHNVIKRIAVAKTYKIQNWFNDLKNGFLKSASERELQQVILHISMNRLFEMVEQSSRSILRAGFKNYVQNNRDAVENTRKEFVFVLKLLRELTLNVNK